MEKQFSFRSLWPQWRNILKTFKSFNGKAVLTQFLTIRIFEVVYLTDKDYYSRYLFLGAGGMWCMHLICMRR